MLDFSRIKKEGLSMAELAAGLTVDELHHLSDEMIDTLLSLIANIRDEQVTFQPVDPVANDTFATNPEDVGIAWTLGHVIVHTTASSEESAALASSLARGIDFNERSRYETPWQTVTMAAQLRQRLEESRRMRHAFLNTWPEVPHLEVTHTPNYPNAPARNAVVQFISGLRHEDSHLKQIEDILGQAQAAGII